MSQFAVSRKPINASQVAGYSVAPLFTDGHATQVLKPAVEGVDLLSVVTAQAPSLLQLFERQGALVFRGFRVDNATSFGMFLKALASGEACYREPATPRSHVIENVFTSTEYPADQEIQLHNENSHCTAWPLKIAFHCELPPGSGGETPFADCRRVLKRLDPALVKEFRERGLQYVRRFDGRLGFKWHTVFDTDSRDKVEEYCAENCMTFEWGSNDRLTVRYVREAVRRHPRTGEEVWFNHGYFFNPHSLRPDIRASVIRDFGADAFPYDTMYGDGTPIPETVWVHIRDAYHAETKSFPWQKGDVLLLDNMAFAHGRRSFTGSRRILVAMSDEYRPTDAPAR